MTLLIKFPTRGRKDKCLATFRKYHEMCADVSAMRFAVSIDHDDREMNDPAVVQQLEALGHTSVVVGTSRSKIEAVNRDMERFTGWDIVLLASDDMIPQVAGYDAVIRERMQQYFPDTDGVLWFNDGFLGKKLNTLCILGRKYYERFGYIYYPGYRSTWCDNEFTDVATALGKQRYFDEVLIRHEHPDWGYGQQDHIHHQNLSDLRHDKKLYKKRRAVNFDL